MKYNLLKINFNIDSFCDWRKKDNARYSKPESTILLEQVDMASADDY